MSQLDEDALIERTLFHLNACRTAADDAERSDIDVEGPEQSSWADLLAAVMEGFERGWVEHAELWREEGETQLNWGTTDRGERALSAFRVRLSNAEVIDEEDDANGK